MKGRRRKIVRYDMALTLLRLCLCLCACSAEPAVSEGVPRRAMSSPVGSTPSQLLAQVMAHLDDGIFVHILFHPPHHHQHRGGDQAAAVPVRERATRESHQPAFRRGRGGLTGRSCPPVSCGWAE